MHVFLSYPKSGRTWIRFIVNSYHVKLHGLELGHIFEAEKHPNCPANIEWTHLSGAMLFKRHYYEMGPLDLGQACHLPWFLLTRNFYATMASAYFQARDRIRVFDGSTSQFVRHPRYGIIKLVTFYNLFEQIRGALDHVHIFNYDQVRQDPAAQMSRILEALDRPVDPALLEQVLQDASIDNMRQLSVSPQYAGTVLAPANINDPNTYKVRSSGNTSNPRWHDLFTDEDVAYIDTVIDALLIEKDAEHYRICRGTPPVHNNEPQSLRAAG